MVFDFNAGTIATTGLMGYDREAPRQLFLDGVINKFKRVNENSTEKSDSP